MDQNFIKELDAVLPPDTAVFIQENAELAFTLADQVDFLADQVPKYGPKGAAVIHDMGLLNWTEIYLNHDPRFSAAEELFYQFDVPGSIGHAQTLREFFEAIRSLMSVPHDAQPVEFSGERLQKFLLDYRVSTTWLTCILKYKIPIHELIGAAQDGDLDSAFKLIRIEKCFMTSDWFMYQIQKSAIEGQREFFERLGRVSKEVVTKFNFPKTRLKFFLALFYPAGICNIPRQMLLTLLEGYDLYKGDEFNLNNIISRLGLILEDGEEFGPDVRFNFLGPTS